MHHEPAPEAGTPHRPHDLGGPPSDPVVRDLCMSVFDRWRCALADGHEGLHAAEVDGTSTSWNDAASGRRLRGL